MDTDRIYSYTAVFEDGTIIVQDHTDPDGDTSLTQENGSRFTDVLAKEKESKLVSFVLHNDTVSAGVDLRDGHFEINGVPFFLHRYDREHLKDFRIIFFRSVRETKSGLGTTKEIMGHSVGWQTTDSSGKNVQKTIMI